LKKYILKEDGGQHDYSGVGHVGPTVPNDIPRTAAAFGLVGAYGVEEQLIRGGLLDEIVAIIESVDAVELGLDKVVDSFDVGLPAMSTRRDSEVTCLCAFNCLSKAARLFRVPRANELRAIVGLNGHAAHMDAATAKVIDDPFGEEFGVDSCQLL
jgi:hypothetical protein